VGPTKSGGTLNPPNGDVFAEMKDCLDRGISGRPVLARFVEVTYEAILSLKAQIDRIETSLPHREPATRRSPGPGVRSHRRR
jgi:hypothetical protein